MDSKLLQGVYRIKPAGPLRGTLQVPGDKSISHRAVMLSSLAEGASRIYGFLESEDCTATLNAFQKMGIAAQRLENGIAIQGQGLHGLREPDDILDMGNSGTGSRLILGILAGQPFASTLTGDSSLRSRPMGRVTQPLSRMGATFIGREKHTQLPLSVYGGNLVGIDYESPVASAQVKSAILLAGLFAKGVTRVREPGPSRDHTERMLKTFGVPVQEERYTYTVEGQPVITGCNISVPGDLSSAAFWIVAAAIVPDSDLTLTGVGVNPTRTGLLDVLREMGADVTLENQTYYGAEPVADIRVRYSPLRGVRISGETVVRMIDEFPIFAVAAACADSPSVVTEAKELRMKESDRIAAIVQELGKLGAEVREWEDGFEVTGKARLRGAEVFSRGDHRIAMSLTIAALTASGETLVQGTAPIATSFPGFFERLAQVAPGSGEVVS